MKHIDTIFEKAHQAQNIPFRLLARDVQFITLLNEMSLQRKAERPLV